MGTAFMEMLGLLMGETLSGVLGIAIGSSGVVGVSFCVKTGFCVDDCDYGDCSGGVAMPLWRPLWSLVSVCSGGRK